MKNFLDLHLEKNYTVKVEKIDDGSVMVSIPANILRSPEVKSSALIYSISENILIKRVISNEKKSKILLLNKNSSTVEFPKYCIRISFIFDLMFEISKYGIGLDLVTKYKENKLVYIDTIDIFDQPKLKKERDQEELLLNLIDEYSSQITKEVPEDIEEGYKLLLNILRNKGIHND